MTKEEILALSPGVELNAKVAKEIMGHLVVNDALLGPMVRLVDEDGSTIWHLPQPYSQDISVARLVVRRMVEFGCDDARYFAGFGGGIYTEAEAICKAALLDKREGG